MLTIFSCPRAFKGVTGIIQRNAIKSWTLLEPRPEIILIGEEEGTVDISGELGLHYVPAVERNEYGAPLVSSVFSIGQEQASCSILCYLNADLILMSDFFVAISRVLQKYPKSVIIGRKWDMEVKELSFDKGWEVRLRARVREDGKLHPSGGIDYFVFPRGFFTNLPPFALGRTAWDNWLVYYSSLSRIPVVDITQMVSVVHQRHGYSHHLQKELGLWGTEEAKNNFLLAGGHNIYLFTIKDACFKLTQRGIRRKIFATFYIRLVKICIFFPFLKSFLRKLRVLADLEEYFFYRKLLKEYAHKKNTTC